MITLTYQQKYGPLTNDSVIPAVAVRLDADFLVTADEVFEKVEDRNEADPSRVVSAPDGAIIERLPDRPSRAGLQIHLVGLRVS